MALTKLTMDTRRKALVISSRLLSPISAYYIFYALSTISSSDACTRDRAVRTGVFDYARFEGASMFVYSNQKFKVHMLELDKNAFLLFVILQISTNPQKIIIDAFFCI